MKSQSLLSSLFTALSLSSSLLGGGALSTVRSRSQVELRSYGGGDPASGSSYESRQQPALLKLPDHLATIIAIIL